VIGKMCASSLHCCICFGVYHFSLSLHTSFNINFRAMRSNTCNTEAVAWVPRWRTLTYRNLLPKCEMPVCSTAIFTHDLTEGLKQASGCA